MKGIKYNDDCDIWFGAMGFLLIIISPLLLGLSIVWICSFVALGAFLITLAKLLHVVGNKLRNSSWEIVQYGDKSLIFYDLMPLRGEILATIIPDSDPKVSIRPRNVTIHSHFEDDKRDISISKFVTDEEYRYWPGISIISDPGDNLLDIRVHKEILARERGLPEKPLAIVSDANEPKLCCLAPGTIRRRKWWIFYQEENITGNIEYYLYLLLQNKQQCQKV